MTARSRSVVTTSRAPRRAPVQQRSRERVEAILAAAHDLIVDRGSDALKMSDIAAAAGVPIGSLYQYFPDKAAILRELAVRFMARVRSMLGEGLAGIVDKGDALARMDALIAGYYQLFLDEPDIRDVWAATQSDKELQLLDIDDSRANGQIVFDAIEHLVPPSQHERLAAVTFLFTHLAGAAARLAIAVDRVQADRMMSEFRVVLYRHLDELIPG